MGIVFKAELPTDEGDTIEVEFPAVYAVCPTCQGKGTHVNPSIDGNGLSREDFDEDPDFAESYWRGDYDVVCQECKGQRVVAEIDEDGCKRQGMGEELQKYYEQLEYARESEMEREAERRMGA